MVDPFYQVMQIGVEKAAADLGVEVVTQIPPTWGVEAQTPILDALIARGDLDYIITAPVDKDQMVGPLQAAVDAGIKIITVDTFLGDGDYAGGPVTFPISYIGSDNVEGGRISARGLAKAIGGKGTVYINSTNPNVSSVEGREQGFAEVMKNEFPDIKVIGPDYNLDDAAKATQQTAAVLEREPDLAGVFGTNVFSAQGAGQAVINAGLGGHVQVVAYDATKDAIESMNQGVVSLVLAQKPFDMGYMAVAVRRRRRRRRHQPAEAGGDRLRDHRQGQHLRPRDRALHLPGARRLTARAPGSAPSGAPPAHPHQERDRVTALDPSPSAARTPAQRAVLAVSNFWAWAFLGLMVALLRHRGAAHQRRRRSASSPSATRRTSSSPSPPSCSSASARPSSSSAPASTSRSAG